MLVLKTARGIQMKDQEKVQLKAIVIANKKGIEEAKVEREKLIILTECSGKS